MPAVIFEEAMVACLLGFVQPGIGLKDDDGHHKADVATKISVQSWRVNQLFIGQNVCFLFLPYYILKISSYMMDFCLFSTYVNYVTISLFPMLRSFVILLHLFW